MKKVLALLFIFAIAAGGFLAGRTSSSTNSGTADLISPSTLIEPTQGTVEISEPTDPQAVLAWNALMDPTGEYAAFAMYTAVIDKYGQVEPYVSVRDAEQKHIDALIRQLTNYGISVPQNPYLDDAIAPADLQTAATAWATGEVENVALYDELLSHATDSNLIRVFTNLRRASLEMHLPLFEAAAQNGGQLTSDQMAQYMHG